MGEPSQEPVLRRKVGARRASLGIAEMTPSKAMRLALAKVGDAMLNVPVALREFSMQTVTPDTLPQAVSEPALFLKIAAETGETGLAVVCPQAIAATIEAQTLGRVGEGTALARKPTATDASLTRGFVDQVLSAFALIAEECGSLPALDGYRFSLHLPDARVAAMAIDDARHNHFIIEADFAGGAKTGTIHYILPDRQRRVRPKSNDGSMAEKMERAVLSSKAQLHAQLCTVTIPLHVAQDFHVGQILPLADTTLDSVTLHAIDGRKILSGRMGKSGAMRAVRVHSSAPTRDAPGLPGGAAPAAALMAPPDTPALDAPAPMADMGGLEFPGPDPDPLPDLPGLDDPMPSGGADALPELGGGDPLADLDTTPLDDLPATLDPMPLALDLPE